ncbi:cyanate transporter [Pseudomonas benzenivorans]|uniref:Cyanate transporter n=1 Tax=Pseudomonas benzenivorans TaxID=556533 RepID=A0ABY5H7T9_9PSED|nr:cyanate transporter [Pseudomonas benzenivorans]UTW08183.1 cyanate transporter [Pseudomonas benzenivorans]
MEQTQTVRATVVVLTVSIVLVALNLRPSMAAIGPILSAIRQDVPLTFSMASLLTMLPVMAMGLAMFVGIGVAKAIGEHRAIVLSLVIITLATGTRLFVDTGATLVFTAVLAGIGIAIVQAVMPAFIKARYAPNVSLYMGLYVTSIMGGAALAASFSPLVLEITGSWRLGLSIWAGLSALALVVWMTQKTSADSVVIGNSSQREKHFSNSRSWLLAIFFGLGTSSYTCVLAWLAPYYVEKGWTEQHAGLILGLLTTMEVISGLATPAIANKSHDRRKVLVVLLFLIIIGFAGLVVSPNKLSLLWPCLLGLGIGGLFPMSLIVSMDHIDSPMRAGGLAAFVQGIGYLIAGLSPLLAGIVRDQMSSFEWAWWSLAIISAVMLLMVFQFNPRHYSRHYI